MEGILPAALQAATNVWQNYLSPAVQGLTVAVRQIQSHALIQSVAQQALNFAATPLGMGIIGTAATVALIGTVILIRRCTGSQTSITTKSHPQQPVFFGPELLPNLAQGSVPRSVSRPLSEVRVSTPTAAARSNEDTSLLRGLEVMQQRAYRLPRNEETSSALVATTQREPQTLVINSAELDAILRHFNQAQQRDLQNLIQRTNFPTILVVDVKGSKSAGLLAIKDKEAEDSNATAQDEVDPDVVATAVAATNQLLQQHVPEESSKTEESSPPTSPNRRANSKSPTRRTRSGRLRFAGTPMRVDTPPRVLKGEEAVAACGKIRRLTRTLKQAFLNGTKGFDTTNQRPVDC